MEEPMANIAARKKLSALYVQGVKVRFTPEGPKIANPKLNKGEFAEDDPIGPDDVEVWVGPPNPHQREMALRDAQAARARALLRVKNEKDSEESLTVRAFLADMSLETLIDYLLISEQEARINEAMRDVLGEKEWENFDELRDSMAQYEEALAHWEETHEGNDPREDPEWKPLIEAEQRYASQVDIKERELRDGAVESMKLLPREELERRAAEKRGEIVGSTAFMVEYESQMRFYSTRDPDKHDVLFFDSVREYREAEEIVQGAIGEALRTFINDGTEAKN